MLSAGEIEAYLPPGVSDVRAVVEMSTNRDWINDVTDENRRIELGRIVCLILGATAEEAQSLEMDLLHRRVKFPLPISERQTSEQP